MSLLETQVHPESTALLVVWVRSVYDFKCLNAPYRLKRGEEGCCLEGTWGVEFFNLHPEPDEVVITKHHYSAFF
ncbi:MAG: isochorismatase family protein [Pusillimonas sp.]|nr:isochorismatase family protein [Pusillimonas sp.]